MTRGRGGTTPGVSTSQTVAQEEKACEEEESGASGGGNDMEGKEPTLSDMMAIFQKHMGQQEAREAKQNEVTARQEHRFKALQHQFQLLQLEVQARTSLVPPPLSADSDPPDMEVQSSTLHPLSDQAEPMIAQTVASAGQSCSQHKPRLEKLTDNDDIEHFLITFERIAVACRWQKADWVFQLIPLLTGKARGAYVHMDIDDSLDYEQVKSAILAKYDINPETYRQRFRSLEVDPDESPKELYARLKESYGKWIQPKGKTIQEIGEVIILEQYLRMLSPELQVWVREHGPDSAMEAARLADVFVAARKKGQPWSYHSWRTAEDNRKPTHHPGTGVGKFPMRESQPASRPLKPVGRKPICYLCGVEGHTKPMCPKNSVNMTQMCFVPRTQYEPELNKVQSIKMTHIEVNGKMIKALLDSGSDQTLVHRNFVPPNIISTEDTIPICCVHGDEKSYSTADMYIKVDGQTYLLNIGVVDSLPFPAVLGRDLPVLFDLLESDQSRKCNAAVTRAQAIQSNDYSETLCALPFYNYELETAPGKSRKTRRQRRQEKFQHTLVKPPTNLEPELPLGFQMPDNIIEMQKADPSLVSLFQKAEGKEPGAGLNSNRNEYIHQNGMLYYQQGSVLQLVVPQAIRHIVLTMGHSVPWAGHLGKHKTTARIKRHFHWPGLSREVAEFCRSCPECQITSAKTPSKAPLRPLPIIDTPFERLGMDIVGPVERSKSGNRYMLVITDYATKYPDVFPLKTVKAKSVAFCLVQFFSRVGFPCEILTDQGTNFMSILLKQVYQLLGIRSLRTTPYHPQTDGLTERFNQTLKQMLRKFVNNSGTDWDQWLPYLLFAYREVPQASTGFSPFELLYGHEVRGPLSLLREIWEGGKGKGESLNVISYVVQMREQLEKMSELAQSHMREAQQQQKSWYDRSARQRSFNSGQKVLVLLPSDDNKLLAKWQGPFEILKKLGPTTYQVATPGRPRASRTLHINLLKEWVPRPERKEVMPIRGVQEEEEVDEQYLPSAGAPGDHKLNHLSEDKQLQVREICNSEVFQENPGRTNIVEHDIVMKEGASVRRLSYRIPERLLASLKKEIDLMLSLGIIEISRSEWCNPVVLVPKKDGSLRFCIDFSTTWEEHLEHLNAVLDRLHAAGLTINSSKCVFAAAETKYLGHSIGNGVIRPQVNKIQAIGSCPLPHTRKQLRSFLGMAGFYHRFIPQFSTRAALLTDMTGSRCPNQIQWTEEAVAAFHDIQQSLRTTRRPPSSCLHQPENVPQRS
ncbi:uncharacterized protein LOC127372197 isoform X2 [Dicentrarchus labrax]|uniref:uncharacterized protein LOC127372197 isoform X2 n=1 Tax=Dicentrarchus labrax TaxID=13489 RepID=UPI0021F5E565|nr:uncharacterized protein LOC127372197 isoform X2 [Dicentrarchus labrax]